MSKSLSLLDYCETTSKIECEKCGDKEITDEDAMEAIDTFYDKGWRIVNGDCLCASCAKKAKK